MCVMQVLKMIVHVIQEMLADTLENPESLSFPELSEYERSFFHSLNKHVVGMLLLCRREATAIITDICQVRTPFYCFLHFMFRYVHFRPLILSSWGRVRLYGKVKPVGNHS